MVVVLNQASAVKVLGPPRIWLDDAYPVEVPLKVDAWSGSPEIAPAAPRVTPDWAVALVTPA